MAIKSKVFRNFLALGSGEALSRVIAFAATVYLARLFGAEGFGVVVFAIAINLYLMKVVEFAIEWSGTEAVTKDPSMIPALASAILCARLLLAIIIIIISASVTWWVLPEPERSTLLIYLLVLIPVALNTKWVHVGLEDTRPVGLSRVLGETLSLIIILGLVHSKGDIWVAPVAQICGETFIAIMLISVLRKNSYKFNLQWNPKVAFPVFRKAMPLLGHMLMGLFIYNSDMIFLRLFHDSTNVGLYSVSYTLISFIANLGLAYGMSLLPAFTHATNTKIEETKLYQNSLAQIFAVSLPLTIGGFILAPNIIEFVFGEGYSASILALQLLMWSVPANLIRLSPWSALIARNHQGFLFKAIVYAAVANIILNLLLIPNYGIVGAAIATIITEIIISAIMLTYASNIGLTFLPMSRFVRAIISGIGMAAVMYAFSPLNLFIGIALGGAVYILLLSITGGIKYKKGTMPTLNV